MDRRTQQLCALSGVGCVALFMIGFFLVAGFIPPPSPNASAHDIGEFYRQHSTGIRVGMVISMFAAGLTGPWVAAMTVQLRRIEGWSVLVLTQFALGTLLVLEFILFLMFWEVAAFRTERSDESIQLVNDLGWIPFIGLTSTAILQASVIAIVILRDRSATPVLPRWAAYFNIWVALAFLPGGWNCLFKTGPVAWDGILSFYVAMVAFLTWYLANTYAVLRGIANTNPGPGELGHDAPGDPRIDELVAEVARLRGELTQSRAATL
jgi:hypothetical protein